MHSARSSRIEKPRSNNNSPHRLERRRAASLARTTALQSSTANGPYNDSLDHHTAQPYQSNARPITWHPESFQNVQPLIESQDHIEQSELDTEGFSQNFKATPLHRGERTNLDWNVYQPSNYQYQPNYPQFPTHGVNWDAYQILNNGYSGSFVPEVPDHTWYLPGTGPQFKEQAYEQPASQSSTTESLSIQHPPDLIADSTPQMQQTAPNAASTEREDRILVGLGLYDPPATPPHPFMSALNQGKGLKLEEPWAPPPDSEDEDAEGEDEGDGEHGDGTYGLPVASQNVVKQMQKQAQIHDQTQLVVAQEMLKNQQTGPQSLGSQSFVLGSGDALDGDWWCNPAAKMRAQEQSFGSGWLHM